MRACVRIVRVWRVFVDMVWCCHGTFCDSSPMILLFFQVWKRKPELSMGLPEVRDIRDHESGASIWIFWGVDSYQCPCSSIPGPLGAIQQLIPPRCAPSGRIYSRRRRLSAGNTLFATTISFILGPIWLWAGLSARARLITFVQVFLSMDIPNHHRFR